MVYCIQFYGIKKFTKSFVGDQENKDHNADNFFPKMVNQNWMRFAMN